MRTIRWALAAIFSLLTRIVRSACPATTTTVSWSTFESTLIQGITTTTLYESNAKIPHGSTSTQVVVVTQRPNLTKSLETPRVNDKILHQAGQTVDTEDQSICPSVTRVTSTSIHTVIVTKPSSTTAVLSIIQDSGSDTSSATSTSVNGSKTNESKASIGSTKSHSMESITSGLSSSVPISLTETNNLTKNKTSSRARSKILSPRTLNATTLGRHNSTYFYSPANDSSANDTKTSITKAVKSTPVFRPMSTTVKPSTEKGASHAVTDSRSSSSILNHPSQGMSELSAATGHITALPPGQKAIVNGTTYSRAVSGLSIFEQFSGTSTGALFVIKPISSPSFIPMPFEIISTLTVNGDTKKWNDAMSKLSCKPPCTQTLPPLTLVSPFVTFWPFEKTFCSKPGDTTYASTVTFAHP